MEVIFRVKAGVRLNLKNLLRFAPESLDWLQSLVTKYSV